MVRVTEIAQKIKNRLNQNIWYHGTVLSNWDSFRQNGVIVDYNKDTSNALDYGYGFYLAPSKEKAESYIKGMIKNTSFYSETDQPLILGFEFVPLKWFEEDEYKTKIFNKYDDEFASFVFKNRTENIMGTKQHAYDVIYGVMTDAVPTILIAEYQMGIKSKEEVMEGLKKPTSMKQISLHSQKLCDIIKLKEAYVIDLEKNERKELDI